MMEPPGIPGRFTGKKEAAFSWTLGARWRPKGMDPLLHAWCAELAHEALAGHQHEMVTRIGRHIFYR
jgi:hypothetical protein